jgi:periplasmic glucans biosynthesis protein
VPTFPGSPESQPRMASCHSHLLVRSLLLLIPLWIGGCDSRGGEDVNPVQGDPGDEGRIPPPLTQPAHLFDQITARAQARAETAWYSPRTEAPPELLAMDYDQYRSIRFRPDSALWRGESDFEVQFFHPGFLYPRPVWIYEAQADTIVPINFRKGLFRYEGSAASLEAAAPDPVGFAGFRIHYPLNAAGVADEVAVFLGASYFRLLGRGHAHGLSSRGIAINTTRGGEEFPDFREFWLVRPTPEDETLRFYALLDGPSLTGAYQFELKPGQPTEVVVDARLFARQDVAVLGVAPLTSMFLYAPESARSFDDFRPRVHDSDGLLLHTAQGEWWWRPLRNGPGLRVTPFQIPGLQGFGLTQRAREFSEYLDLEARYHDRTSQWVERLEGDWGEGTVELLEIPTNSEFHDNIVAFWVPPYPFRKGDARSFRYRLLTFDDRLESQTLAQVERMRIGWVALPGEVDPPPTSHRRFVLDFSPGSAGTIQPASEVPVVAVLEASSGEVSDLRVQALPEEGGWRATFRLAPEEDQTSELRLYLVQNDRAVSETWSYLWVPVNDR